MALDGISIAAVIHELSSKLTGGRIDKIYQPEKEEVIINIRSQGSNHKLLMTASPSHPRLHITAQAKENPLSAPLFCMVLRKHLTGGKITKIAQSGFERIAEIGIEALNEMGDLTEKRLIIEIMGKHSNVILVDENDIILDSIKRISHETSAVREVLPGKKYVLPPDQNKINPMEFDRNNGFCGDELSLQQYIYKTYCGISPFMADALCFMMGIDGDKQVLSLSSNEKASFCDGMEWLKQKVKSGDFNPVLLSKNEKPIDFAVLKMEYFNQYNTKEFDSSSEMLEYFYSHKDAHYRILQKTTDMRKLIQKKIERCVRKRDMHLKMLNDVKDRDIIKIKGELLTANIYSVEKGMTSFVTQNFYDENLPEIKIELDPTLMPSENAQKYFKKYNKEKRTFAAVNEQMAQNDEEMEYLESVLQALEICVTEADIEALREELTEQGFLRKKKGKKQKIQKSKPMHFISSDGFHIYVGKNNMQNDELTLKFAQNNDMWFHTKDIPGSHVIVQTVGQKLPDKTVEEAAMLAAYFSKGKNGSHVPVDYTIKKNVKKPNGAKPGMVIYERNQTAYMTPTEEYINSIKKG